MTPNLQQAQSFLTALDEDSDAWSFQTFDDGPNKTSSLARQFHGGLEQHATNLAALNERGAGVFVTVNETNGKGRKKADITRIRALFVDLDGSPLGPVQNAANEPNVIVQTSPGRFHSYWKVSDCPVDQCEPALKQLIGKFDADPSCCDCSRVLRLPGFYHRKRDPHLVRVLATSPGEYRMSDFGFSLDAPHPTERTERYRDDSSHISVLSVGDAITALIPKVEGERNRCLFELARWVKAKQPNASGDELRRIVRQWHEAAMPNIRTKEFGASWYDFRRGFECVKYPAGTTLTEILGEIDMNTKMPDSILQLGYGGKGNHLVMICKRLQEQAGDAPFFLSSRQAGDVVGLHYTEAAKLLWSLRTDGVIDEVSKGAGNKASRYRYVWHE